MLRVLGPIAGDHLKTSIILLQREADLDDVMAGLHHLQDAAHLLGLIVPRGARFHHVDEVGLDQLTSTVEEVLHHLEELRVGLLGDRLRGGRGRVNGGGRTGPQTG